MKTIKQIFRLLEIYYILAKNGFDNVLVSLHVFGPFRFILYCNPWNWFRQKNITHGEALRKTLEELGPIFVKFGQALSTRPDILPEEFAKELNKLQDNVQPFSSEEALNIIQSTFGQSAYQIFEQFDPLPLASASIAQVHAATLHSGESVVVKLLRPRIKQKIDQDLRIMHSIARLAQRYWPESRRFKPVEIVKEFEFNLLDELDLQREAANATQFYRNFQGSSLLMIPLIYWQYVRKNVLVMQRIHGIPVSDIPRLREHGIDLKKLAERGVKIFFTQVFRDCFFHADMHPGNIFISPLHPENPQYMCVDFGIVGTLNDKNKRYIAEMLHAFFHRDYKRVAELHVESGWVARDTRVEQFESAIRTVCEPIFEKPLKDISFAQVILRLFQVARRFQMEVQPQLLLLQKTLFAIEGLGRQLYPELDLWSTAKPFLEKWLRQQLGPKVFLQKIKENIPFLVEELPHMPKLIFDVLQLTKENQSLAHHQNVQLSLEKPTQKSVWPGVMGMIFLVALSGLGLSNLLNLQQISLAALFGSAALGLLMVLRL
jgi:ubiquinone biosynthesis protein